jgi:hypothetical protein
MADKTKIQTLQTMEVAIARVYNWEVVTRRKAQEEGKDKEEGG